MKSLRSRLLISVGFIIFVVLGISTLMHINDLKHDYLMALEARSEAMVQGLMNDIMTQYNPKYVSAIGAFSGLSLQCQQLYESNNEKGVVSVAIINPEGIIVAHNDRQLKETPSSLPQFQNLLKQSKIQTLLIGEFYHTVIPLVTKDQHVLGAIEIVVTEELFEQKVHQVLIHAVLLFLIFLAAALTLMFILVTMLLSRPVHQLVSIGEEFARGTFIALPPDVNKQDEIGRIGRVFHQISEYLQEISTTASHIATGTFIDNVRIRSQQDALGRAFRDMVAYLRHAAEVMSQISEGNLTVGVQIRSAADAFGQVITAMTENLRSLIARIRNTSRQIADTGEQIRNLASHDIEIAKNVTHSVENMIATMNEMAASVEEVTHSTEVLSSSVEETSASVSQMSSSIRQIAENATALTDQTHNTIASLHQTVTSLGEVVRQVDTSKQLSQETSQDAAEGQQAVELVISSMETIHDTVTTAVKAITQFSERSQDIDTMLAVIRNITEQTSLLALNASIIAAQAGAHGRGFAVVADEIKSLANGVGASTKEIAAVVQTLKRDTANVVQTIHEGAASVEQGMMHTQQARATLQKILESAQHSSNVVTDIATTLHALMSTSEEVAMAMAKVDIMTNDITRATNEQKTTTSQIDQAISHINDMAAQIHIATSEQLRGIHQVLDLAGELMTVILKNQESSSQITNTAEALSRQADELLHSVDRFRLQE